MKTRTIFALVLIIAIAYSGLWYYFAKRLERHTYDEVEKQGLTLQADQTSIGGFPFHFELTFKNPKLMKGDTAILSTVNGEAVETFSLLYNPQHLALRGRINVSIPSLGELEKSEWLFDGAISADLSASSKSLDKLSIQVAPTTVSNVSGSSFFKSVALKAFEMDYSKNGQDQTLHVVGDLSTKEQMNFAFPEHNAGLQALAKELNKVLQQKTVTTNIEFEFQYLIPNFDLLSDLFTNPKRFFEEKVPHSMIRVRKWEMSNDFGASSWSGMIDIYEESDKRLHAEVSGDAATSYKQAYYDVLLSAVEDLQKASKSFTEPSLQKLKTLLQAHPEKVVSVIPKIHEFSPITFHNKWSVNWVKGSFDASVQLDDLSFGCPFYGAKIGGKIAVTRGLPSLGVLFQWTNYKGMIHDMIDYYNRLTVVINALKSENVTDFGVISSATEASIVGFFRVLSDAPQSENSDLSISVNLLNGKTNIGSLSWESFKKSWDELFNKVDAEMRPQPQLVPQSISPKK